MSRVLSLQLKDNQAERLERAAQRLGLAPEEAGVLLLEESLREGEFPSIEFHDTAVGRQAFLGDMRLSVWPACWLTRHFDGVPARVAEAIEVPCVAIEAALTYAEAYPAEIEAAIADNSRSVEELKQIIPNLEVFVVDSSAP